MGGIGSGGFREGAGRKPEDTCKKITLSVCVPAWVADLVQSTAVYRQQSVSSLVTELLVKGMEKE